MHGVCCMSNHADKIPHQVANMAFSFRVGLSAMVAVEGVVVTPRRGASWCWDEHEDGDRGGEELSEYLYLTARKVGLFVNMEPVLAFLPGIFEFPGNNSLVSGYLHAMLRAQV